jgi:hypothetical protein
MSARFRVALASVLLSFGCVDLTPPGPSRPHDAAVDQASPADTAAAEAPARADAEVDLAPDIGAPGEAGSDPDPDAFADVGAPTDVAAEAPADAPIDSPADIAEPPRLPNGATCRSDRTCASDACVDGVCCDGTCGGPCQACNVGGKEGLCTPIPAGLDPAQECDADSPASCGHDGACDGAGACRRFAPGTECAPPTCVAGTETSARSCDGLGTCRPATSRACAPNLCATDVCAQICTGAGDCQNGFFCDSGMCRAPRGTGAGCTAAGQCSSGSCVDGVCCTSACTQPCFACNLAGSLGTCSPIAAAQDPAGECPAQAASTCGRAGGCDGAGACRRHPAGTICAAASCTGSSLTGASACNAGGTCVAPAASDCGAYLCNGAACGTTCSTAGQCKTGNVCTAAACVPPCSPESTAAFCARLGKTCGSVTAVDNCGSSRVANCGSCAAPMTCGGGGVANQCGTPAPACVTAYAQANCVGYNLSTRVSFGGHNWTCSNGNCANCATNAGCAPRGTGCPWGVVWTDDGACQ